VFRRELLAFCYRMLGSAEDAEEVVQETYLSAWRSYDTFEGRSSLRTWLYRIAARACLKALDGARRRPFPSDIAGPSADPDGEVACDREVTWLLPFPSDPASIVETRATMRLALVAAFQHLPPRQRPCSSCATCWSGAPPRSPASRTCPPQRSTAPCNEPGRSSPSCRTT
jgi:RNA polymerase sigma-70 factor (ECF subfamily)